MTLYAEMVKRWGQDALDQVAVAIGDEADSHMFQEEQYRCAAAALAVFETLCGVGERSEGSFWQESARWAETPHSFVQIPHAPVGREHDMCALCLLSDEHEIHVGERSECSGTANAPTERLTRDGPIPKRGTCAHCGRDARLLSCVHPEGDR